MSAAAYVLPLSLAYLVGNFSPGLLLTRLAGKGDVRGQGSGTTGATNTARALGKNWGAVVLVLDMLKSAVAVLCVPTLAGSMLCTASAYLLAITNELQPNSAFAVALCSGSTPFPVPHVSPLDAPALWLHVACGAACVIGHIWPVLLRFRGGKGVAPFLGIWLSLAFLPRLAPLTDFCTAPSVPAALPPWLTLPDSLFLALTLGAPIFVGLFFLPLKKPVLMTALCGLWAQPLALYFLTHDLNATLAAALAVACVLAAHRTNFNKHFGKKTEA
jgi:glycerol-3-phosphate acyltransferase PlsY